MTWEKAENILNNIFLSLAIRRGTFFADPSFGSRLHELKRHKNTPEAASLATGYCREALQWIIDMGKATGFDIEVERDTGEAPHRLKILIRAYQADSPPVSFETYQEVA